MEWLDRIKKNTMLRLAADSHKFAKGRASHFDIPLSEYLTNLIDADWDRVVKKGESKWEARKS
jgi:hypothetical protein